MAWVGSTLWPLWSWSMMTECSRARVDGCFNCPLTESSFMTRSVLRPLAAFGFVGVVALAVGAQAPDPVTPTSVDERTAKIVVASLEGKHMAKPTIDDETAEKWAKMFFKDLDPQKYYFLKGDIDEFMPQATTLDEKIHEGNLDFAQSGLRPLPEALRRAVQDGRGDRQDQARLHHRRVDGRRPRQARLPGRQTPRPRSGCESGSSSTSSSPRSTTSPKTRPSRSWRCATATGTCWSTSSTRPTCSSSTSAA